MLVRLLLAALLYHVKAAILRARQRGNVNVLYVCAVMQINQARSGRTVGRTAYVHGLFEKSIPLR